MVNKLEKKYSKELQEMTDEEKIYNDWDKEYEDRYIKLYNALEKFVKTTTVNKKGKRIPLIDSVDEKKVKIKGLDGYLVPLSKEEKLIWKKYEKLEKLMDLLLQYDAEFDYKYFGTKNKLLYHIK